MPSRGIFDATVVSNRSLCREHYKLTLRVPGLPESAPGQFVQASCRNPDAGDVEHVIEWSPEERPTIEGQEFAGHEAFLRRPFSIAGRRGDEIDLIGREVGPGTRFLARLRDGDTVSVVGPLGNRFMLPGPGGIALLVAGGVGIPPMIYVAQAIAALNASHPGERPRRAVAFAGALTRDLMSLTITDDHAGSPLHADAAATTAGTNAGAAIAGGVHALYNVAEFRAFDVPAILTTDDGSLGMKGYVTAALERYLDAYLTDNADRARAVVYTCGPEPMMKRVQEIALRRSIRVQIAVERAMACGMGTCQSCCIKVRKPDPSRPPLEGRDWCYRLACTDGPVFDGADLLW